MQGTSASASTYGARAANVWSGGSHTRGCGAAATERGAATGVPRAGARHLGRIWPVPWHAWVLNPVQDDVSDGPRLRWAPPQMGHAFDGTPPRAALWQVFPHQRRPEVQSQSWTSFRDPRDTILGSRALSSAFPADSPRTLAERSRRQDRQLCPRYGSTGSGSAKKAAATVAGWPWGTSSPSSQSAGRWRR